PLNAMLRGHSKDINFSANTTARIKVSNMSGNSDDLFVRAKWINLLVPFSRSRSLSVLKLQKYGIIADGDVVSICCNQLGGGQRWGISRGLCSNGCIASLKLSVLNTHEDCCNHQTRAVTDGWRRNFRIRQENGFHLVSPLVGKLAHTGDVLSSVEGSGNVE